MSDRSHNQQVVSAGFLILEDTSSTADQRETAIFMILEHMNYEDSDFSRSPHSDLTTEERRDEEFVDRYREYEVEPDQLIARYM